MLDRSFVFGYIQWAKVFLKWVTSSLKIVSHKQIFNI
jgi:hypothetical protein